jgi:predicted aspartyl protease
MPVLSGKFDPRLGPIILVGVAPSGTFQPSAATPNLQVQTFNALIDTGASNTCLTRAVADAVGLQPLGMRPMTSASQTTPTNVYLVDLFLPHIAAAVSSVNIMEFRTEDGAPFQMLIGRDIICRGALTLSFDGHFTLAL